MRVQRKSLVVFGALALAVLLVTGCDPASRRLSGQVLIDGTDPAPPSVSVQVYANDAEDLVFETVTDDNGYFWVGPPLADGTSYRIRVNRATWYGGTDWASATPVTAGPDVPGLTISTSFTPGSVTGNFDGLSYSGTIRLLDLKGKTAAMATFLAGDPLPFAFDDVPPGTYRLNYQNDFWDSPNMRYTTDPFEVTAGGTVAREDVFPASTDVRIWVSDELSTDTSEPASLRSMVVDVETGEVINYYRRRMSGQHDLRYFDDREFRVLVWDAAGVYPTQYLGETAENPGGEVFGPSNPLQDSSIWRVHS